ncbi:hypothetical protein LCGC14_1771760, partial [marine sediment metagenome]
TSLKLSRYVSCAKAIVRYWSKHEKDLIVENQVIQGIFGIIKE